MSFIRKYKKNGHTYLAEVETQRVNGKIKQKFIRYVGKERDGKTILSGSISDLAVDEVRSYGPLLVLHHLAEKIKLPDFLGSYAAEILSLVYAHCLDYQSLNQMDQWFKRTDLNMLLGLEELTEDRLESALDSIEQLNIESLQRELFESVKEQYSLKSSAVVYDVTNTYLYGTKCPIAKRGHDKEGVLGRPLIQIGLGVTKEEGIPVFHKTFDGNIHDSKTLQDVVTTFRSYNINSGVVVYDKGITSGQNLADFKALKWDVICGVTLIEKIKAFWRPLLASSKELALKDRVQLNKSTFYVTSKPYSLCETRGYLHLCFNPRHQLDLQDSRREEIIEAKQLLLEGKTIKPELAKYFDEDHNIISKKLSQAEEFDGYSCIFSTKLMPKDELIRYYFDKDIVEKAFRSLKGITRLQPIRHWLAKRVVAHVFICYLSCLLLSLLKIHLKPIALASNVALQELQTMYKVYLRDINKGLTLSRVVTLSKKQEKILKLVDKKLLQLQN